MLRYDDDEGVRVAAGTAWEARARASARTRASGRAGPIPCLLAAGWVEGWVSLLSYQHEDQGYPSEGITPPGSGDSVLALVPGAHVRLAAARALAGGMKDNNQSTAVASLTSSPSSLSSSDVVHKIQTLFLANQPSSSSSAVTKGAGNKSSTPSSSFSSLGSAIGTTKTPSRAVPLTSGSGIGPAALGFAVPAKKPTSAGLGSLGAMMGGIGQPPKPKPKAAGSGLGLGMGSAVAPPPAIRSGGASTSLTPTAPALGLGSGPSSGSSAATTDPPNKISTRLAVAEWVRAVGEQQALSDDNSNSNKEETNGGKASHPSLSLLAFVLSFGAVDTASEVRKAMLTAGTALVDAYGPHHCPHIIAHLEGVLSATASHNNNSKGGKKDTYDLVSESTTGACGGVGVGSGPSDVLSSDYRRQACVVLMGAAGRHLAPNDPAVTTIAGKIARHISSYSIQPVTPFQSCYPSCQPKTHSNQLSPTSPSTSSIPPVSLQTPWCLRCPLPLRWCRGPWRTVWCCSCR